MKDNKGVTLIELVVAIAILGTILASIYSFYLVGVKGFTRETTTATNQVSVRRASNDIAREIRRAVKIELDSADPENVYHRLKLTDSDGIVTEYNKDSGNSNISKTIDGNTSHNWANRIETFEIVVVADPVYDPMADDNQIKQITVLVESIENANMSGSGGQTESIKTVITIRE